MGGAGVRAIALNTRLNRRSDLLSEDGDAEKILPGQRNYPLWRVLSGRGGKTETGTSRRASELRRVPRAFR